MTSQTQALVAGIGAVENANTFVLVTVAVDGTLLDRRTVELTAPGVPTHPHHHEGSWAVGRYLETPGAKRLPVAKAVALVERVRDLAENGARQALTALAASIHVPIASIAIRICPELSDSIEERIRDNRAQSMADSVMYRQALAKAAEARGWRVHWYDRDGVNEAAAKVWQGHNLPEMLRAMGKYAGPPWQAKQQLAAAAAFAALEGKR